MHIRDWPASERPREKLLARGAGSLSDAELLAIFLGSGLRGRDAVATARELLTEHGPLRVLLERSPAQMAELPGLGPARACKLAAALELGHRHLNAELERGAALSDPQSAGRYFAQRLRGLPHEVFAALFLDTRHRAIAFEEMFRGTLDGAEVHPREVVRRALALNAAAVIVGHNHPSGNPEPSAAD
ncbi:MAG TPA: DNA repair protein RadC, partial [Lysobacter sp.]|nr:DNA repair protein RadC [Lysobacter sp.]